MGRNVGDGNQTSGKSNDAANPFTRFIMRESGRASRAGLPHTPLAKSPYQILSPRLPYTACAGPNSSRISSSV